MRFKFLIFNLKLLVKHDHNEHARIQKVERLQCNHTFNSFQHFDFVPGMYRAEYDTALILSNDHSFLYIGLCFLLWRICNRNCEFVKTVILRINTLV